MKNITIVKATYVNEYIVDIEFSDGFKYRIDLKDELWGMVFEPINNIKEFKNFKLNPFTIYWENGADFSPEYLYELAKKQDMVVSEVKGK